MRLSSDGQLFNLFAQNRIPRPNTPWLTDFMKNPPNTLKQQLAGILAVLGGIALLLFPLNSRAQEGLATNSGDWSSTITNDPWADGLVPTNTTDVEIDPPAVVTVDVTNAICDSVVGNGELDMAPNTVLAITGQNNGGFGADQLLVFNATNSGNTVIYQGNSHFCRFTNYYNLSLLGFGTLYNGNVGDPPNNGAPMTIYGNLVIAVGGAGQTTNGVQLANNMTIGGNFSLGTNCGFDASVAHFTVLGNTTVDGSLQDKAGGPGLTDVFSNLTIDPSGRWEISDVNQWYILGNLTNNGTITSHGPTGAEGGITFTNTGIVIGNPFSVANLIVNGTTTFSTTVTATNFVGFGGTMGFDIGAAQHEIICGNPLTYAGNLVVINSGPTPTAGSVYQLFSAPSYATNLFASETFPPLPAGLGWVDNTTNNGTISVVSTAPPSAPIITSSQFNSATRQFTLVWTSQPSVTYSIQYSSNLATDPFTNHILATGIPSGGSSTTNTVTLPAGSPGFLRVSQP